VAYLPEAQRHAARSAEGEEKWKELCKQASTEQDPEKLLALIQEINRLLDERMNPKPPLDLTDSEGQSPLGFLKT